MQLASPRLEWRAVSKSYEQGRPAVRSLSLQPVPGEVTCLLGRNGAGKTTLLEMAVALRTPDGGDVLIDGVSLMSPRFPEVRKQVGFLPEWTALYDTLTPREYLRFVAEIRGADEATEPRIDALLHRLELAPCADQMCSTLSHGQRRKTAFIASVLTEPTILLLDEPTKGMDPVAAREVKRWVRECADSDSVVVFSTHVMELAEHLGDRFAIIDQGELLFHGTLEELREAAAHSGNLEEIFFALTEGGGPRKQAVAP
jgi:ABC-2 type transport system ATP-binding protein